MSDPHLLDAGARREGRHRLIARSATTLALQWIAFLLAPVTFFSHLQVAYALVPWSCARGTTLWLHVAGALSVALAAAGVALSWRVWSREGHDEPGEHGGPAPRGRLIALSGLMMGALFVLLLGGQWLAVWMVSPCQ